MKAVASLIDSDWLERGWLTASGGFVGQLVAGVEATDLFERLAEVPGLLFLESSPAAADVHRLARFSFLAVDPLETVRCEQATTSAEATAVLAEVGSRLAQVATPSIPGLPPFQGGFAGLLSYDHGLALLGLAPPSANPATPSVVMPLYDVVFAFDHARQRAWLISQGFAPVGLPDGGPVARQTRSVARADAMLARLGAIGDPPPRRGMQTVAAVMPAQQQTPLPGHAGILATHTPEAYRTMVADAVELIRRGDIFQVNLAQRFAVERCPSPVAVHLVARQVNAAPFAAVVDLSGRGLPAGDWIVSSSPERLLQVSTGTRRLAQMHPIKGTRRVIRSPEADLYAGADLDASEKDRAENVMIVDLVRNDLSRVCEPASVRVESLCRLERYAYVQHLVSVVSGRLRANAGAVDCLAAVSPGGSVTGAPKRRACEIISELEGIARGPYCGSIGYLSCDGAADFNILIRTFVAAGGCLTFSAGGGITVASQPADEYAETLHKAEGMLRVLEAVYAGGGA
ncbi:MAG: anthranilate synthase component I family protein [Pirellulales bacterium]|jgi:para-aminobenzoate synthetase component 1|nr:anthranilate synthase component I family protein [Pirellulales bacterium]